MHLKGMIFDMDGTLGDTLPICLQGLRETLLAFTGREYTTPELYQMFGPTEEGVIQQRVSEQDFPAALRMYLDRYEELHQSAREPFPGVLRLLEALRSRGIRRGVVTGKGRGTADISMRVMGLDSYIETLVTGSNAGAVKPDAIRRVLEIWQLEPAQVAYVGDMPYDMEAAREAGVLPIGAGWAQTATVQKDNGNLVFESVEDLIRWVQE